MKAMVLEKIGHIESNPLKYREIEQRDPGPGEIQVKIKTCGVCHTDLHEVEGDLHLPRVPIIVGHEIIGIVEKIGDNTENTTINIGDRVGIAWLYSTCGKCKYCFNGMENLCVNARFTGYDVNGGYAEVINVPVKFAYKIPNSYHDAEAAPLMCAGIIGYRSLKLSEIKPGQRLGLFGFGASAHIVIQIALSMDCEVYVFTRSKKHQDHAVQLGAAWVGTSKDDPPKPIDSAITFAPAGYIVLDALKCLDRGGTLAINAIHLSDIPPISWNLLYYERKITSVANTTRQDAIEFLELAKRFKIYTTVTTYPLKNANKAIFDMKHSKINGAAVLECS